MEPYYSEEWHKKNEDRKDFTYTPKVKQQQDAMCWPTKSSTKAEFELADKILEKLITQYE